MTPLGHVSVSYLLGEMSRWRPFRATCAKISLPAVLIGGVILDVDFVFLPFPWFNDIHRVVTHNLFFILLGSLAAGALAAAERRAAAVGFLLGGLLHLLVDSCLDANPSNGIGVAILWPLTGEVFSPFNLVEPIAGASWSQPAALAAASLRGLLWEVPFIAAAVILFARRRQRASATD